MLFPLLLAALPPVSVDWSGVSDATIERCDLSGLESLVLQGMVDEGYAVVRSIPPDGIALVIRAEAGRFTVEGTRSDRHATRAVVIPSPCDSTIQVEILAGMRAVSEELSVEVKVEPPKQTSTSTIAQPPIAIAEPLPWRISGGVGAVLPSETGMFTVRAGVRRRIAEVWFLGVLLEGSVRPSRGVVVFEPVLAAQGVWELWSSASGIAVLIGLEAGLLGHVFTREGDTGGHADGRFGLLIEGRLPVLGATLLVLPYIRMIPVRQEVFGVTAFEAGHFGAVFALSVSFDL